MLRLGLLVAFPCFSLVSEKSVEYARLEDDFRRLASPKLHTLAVRMILRLPGGLSGG